MERRDNNGCPIGAASPWNAIPLLPSLAPLPSPLNQSPERNNIVVLTKILLSHGNSSERILIGLL